MYSTGGQPPGTRRQGGNKGQHSLKELIDEKGNKGWVNNSPIVGQRGANNGVERKERK
jgi:hypothetical protein